MKSGKYTQTISGHTFTAHFDVDGDYPQNKISLTLGSTYPAHWIADLSPDGDNNWEGDIWYRKDNADSLKVSSDSRIGSAGDIPDRIRVYYGGHYAAGGFDYIYVYLKKSGTDKQWKYWYKKVSDHFREVNVEIDHEAGVSPILSLNPHNIDNHRPTSLPNADITIASTFQKAGISIVRNTSNEGAVATSNAGSNSRWSNAELHDAMQTAWSKDEASAWAMWVLQANKHDDDHTGLMFDDIGTHQRCGTALFHGNSGYSGASANVVNRHKFMTLIHEMGHNFNLYHSWVKTSGTSNWSNRVANEPEARSYMNYANRVAAGYYGFFDTFEYRFSDQELLFLRHAPEEFIKMGGNTWGTDHAGAGFDGEAGVPGDEPVTNDLELTVSSNKIKPVYEFLELVNLDLTLTNQGEETQQVDPELLDDTAHMTIKVSRNGKLAKEYKPYATPCHKDESKVSLAKGESITGEICLAGGKLGWVVDEPGRYEISVVVGLHSAEGKENISATPFVFIVAEPTSGEDKTIADDYFNDDVGRVLAMGGTKVLTRANEVLTEVKERLPGSKAAQQADLTLNLPNIRKYKMLQVNHGGTKSVAEDQVDDKAISDIKNIVVNQTATIKENLGGKTFNKLCKKVAENLKEHGDDEGSEQVTGVSQPV